MSVGNVKSDSFGDEVELRCDRFEAEWRSGGEPQIEPYVAEAPQEARAELARELLKLDIYYRRERGDTVLPEYYTSRFPEHSSLIETLLALRSSAERSSHVTHAGRYRLKIQIGRGGMADVYRAYDPDLHRPLAVKVLKEEFKNRSDMMARFSEEAKITGQLQHPGVPPVHELGRLPDGRPFLAMKLIEGRTLAELLAKRKTPSHDLPRFLMIFDHVCQTVAYAHSRRIIHRDLKPANIMVGAFGEVQVMDWGLARRLDSGEGKRTPYDNPDKITLSPVEHDELVARTQLGRPMGTWPYMAPEQARGEWDKVDQRTDVFSLGATLCEILTGEPAYLGPTRGEYEQQAETANLTDAFSRLDACGADAELQTLTKHCLSSLQCDRPRNAATVAAAVTAYQANVQERLRRAELERTQSRVKAFEAQKRRRVLARISDTAIEESLGRHVQLREQDREFLRDVLKDYEEFAAENGDSPEARELRAEGYSRVGLLRHKLGELTDGESAYRTALTIYAQLAADFPKVPEYRQELARVHHNRAYLLADLGQYEQSKSALHAALTILDRLAAEFPNVPEYLDLLAGCHNGLGILVGNRGQLDQAVAAFSAALAIHSKLTTDFPTVPEYRRDLAACHRSLGSLLKNLGKRDRAKAEYDTALAIQDKLATDFPNVPEYRHELARSHNSLGTILAEVVECDRAEAAFRAAVAIANKLAADFPTVPAYRCDLAGFYNNLGRLLGNLGKHDQAEAAYHFALAIEERLTTEFPAVPQYAAQLGCTYGNVGNLIRETDGGQEALEWYRKAIYVLGEVLAKDNRLFIARVSLRDAHEGQAVALDKLKRHAEAAADWGRAIELDEGPKRRRFRIFRAISLAKASDHVVAFLEANDLSRGVDMNAGELYDLARVCSLASAAVKPTESNGEEESDQLKEHYALRALELLRYAFAKGYREVAQMRNDSDLDAIQKRQDFKKLIGELEASQKQ